MKIFISGSKSISKLPELAKTFIDQFIENGDEILVGDCYGIDAVVQKYLESKGFSNVTVYCSGVIPRNNFTSSAKIRSCAEARQRPHQQRISLCERHSNGKRLRPGSYDLGRKKQRHRRKPQAYKGNG